MWNLAELEEKLISLACVAMWAFLVVALALATLALLWYFVQAVLK